MATVKITERENKGDKNCKFYACFAASELARNSTFTNLALDLRWRNSPPSLLIIGNNSLKQLAFGARANSPAPICRSSNCHNPECSRCVRRIMLFLKVVMVVSKSQYIWVKNADTPDLRGAKNFCPRDHAAIGSRERNVALRIVIASTVARRQCMPASLQRAATTDLHADSTVPDPM